MNADIAFRIPLPRYATFFWKVNFSRILFLSPPPIFYIYSFFPDNKSRIDKIIRFLEDKIERFEESIKNWFLNDEKVRILLERRKLFVQRVCKICICMYKARLIVYNVF